MDYTEQEQTTDLFVAIPYHLIIDKNVPPHAKLLYGVIFALCNSKGFCWATNQYFAKEFNTHETTVSKWISMLQNYKYINIEIYDNYKRKIYINIYKRGLAKMPKGFGEIAEGGMAKMPKDDHIDNYIDKITVLQNKNLPKIHTYTYKYINILKSKRKVFAKINVQKWDILLQKLRATVGKERFKEVMNWYGNHITDKYTPKAYSAKAFVEKFSRIEDAMVRADTEHKPVSNLGISTEAKQLAKELMESKKWPMNSQHQLPQVVQMSLDNYRTYRKKHKDIYSQPDRTPPFAAFVKTQLVSPLDFVRGWMKQVNNNINNWKDWSGNLITMVFKTDSKMFWKMGYQWAIDYCGDAGRWDKYIKEFGAVNG